MNKKGIDKSNMDLTRKPGDDFYRYACQGWIDAHPMGDEFSRFGVFDYLRENAREQLKDLVLGLGDNPDSKVEGTIAQKINDLYNMGLDTERLNREGAAPIKPILEKIESFTMDGLTPFVSWLHYGLGDVFFSSGVATDLKDTNRHIFAFGEAGLGLGDRDYYLEDNERNREILEGYEKYVKRIMTLAGYSKSDAERIWNTVIKIEKKIAEHKLTREDRRNPTKIYNIFSVGDFKKRWNFLDWDAYLSHFKVSPSEMNVINPSFMDFLIDFIPSLSEREIKDYMIYSVIVAATGLLGEDFEDADFEFFQKLMSGVREKKPRWKIAMAIPTSMFGEAIGELYVAKYFPPENKQYMKGLVENLRKALAQHISQTSWMSDATKEKALEKLASLKVKIGYPDKWKDYSEIHIDPSKSYWENVFKASLWFIDENLKKLTKPVDKEEWHMFPQTVNAYYSPVNNEICFPAAILQPPYFDPEADDALNYGAIGAVIGHEMTHGFDDQGRQFDLNGNLSEWWQPDDKERFTKLTDKLVEQFDAVEIAPGVNANGRFTLGENIADQGGIRLAMTAYLNSLDGEKASEIDGFSPLQRFFLSYANVWATSIRDEEKLVRTKTDPHSLDENRVNVTLRNIQEFFDAFGIKEGDKMFRPEAERVIIW